MNHNESIFGERGFLKGSWSNLRVEKHCFKKITTFFKVCHSFLLLWELSITCFFFFKLDIFIYISNDSPFPGFLSISPLSHFPSPFFYNGVPPPKLPTLSTSSPWHSSLYWGSSLGRTKGFSSHRCPTRPSSATYAAGAMGLSLCTIW